MARKSFRVSTTAPEQGRSGASEAQASCDPVADEIPDHIWADIRHQDTHSKRLLIAMDFGTTFSAVCYAALDENESTDYPPLDRIGLIKNFPDDWNIDASDGMKNEVPTEIMYPKDPQFRQKEGLIYATRGQKSGRDVDGANDVKMDGDRDDPQIPGLTVTPTKAEGECSQSSRDQDTNEILAMYETTDSLRWGYGVHELWSLPSTHLDKSNRAMARFKLLLDESPATKDVRDDLKETLDALKQKNILNGPVEVIADFLTCLLRHTRSELEAEGFELSDKGSDNSGGIEMVLCVPAVWTQKACRDMQTALALAMSNTGIRGVDRQSNCIDNLFIVSEPEAAAAYALSNNWQIIVLGGLFGSSFLNKGFRKLLKEALKDETYLERENETIDGIIEKIIINEFEYRIKRTFDYTTAKGLKRFSISGLRDNIKKGFARGAVHIVEIFMQCLEGIAGIMFDQIAAAKKGGNQVKKVILIGGFGASPSLRKYLDRCLRKYCAETGSQIILLCPENTTNAVATGAILRAFNKEHGPSRHARSSYGILRTEYFKDWPEHKGLKPTYDEHDGLPYITNTIDWFFKLGQEVPSVWESQPIKCCHTFNCSEPRLICLEELYVSDRATQSHYKRVGDIEVDFTHLRDNGLLQPIEPGKRKRGKNIGVRHYRITFLLVIRVVDRDLKCKCHINIAAAFRPGVK
ncbi:hypothetical protein GQ53DRAFT_633221 [Thozetella sp. PMI_491]|nr:hypothetical protein GQ53DRAFT_633221 [Thozetella sp. PMI_491]